MKNHDNNLLDELLNDPSFDNWVFKRNRNDMVFWDAWISKNPEHVATLITAKDIKKGIGFKKIQLPDQFVDQELDVVLRAIDDKTYRKDFRPIHIRPNKRKQWAVSLSLAAMLLLMFFGVGTFLNSNEVIHKTEYGEIINLKLPDGTTVALNGNSELRYRKDLPRNVYLKGEAYFKVKSKPSANAKFWVNTKDLKVEVYGTQFNVNTRDKKTDVLLDEGSVNLLLDNGKLKEMIPGEIVSYSKENQVIIHKKIDESLKYTVMKEDTFVFNNVTLLEVMHYIKNAYGITSEFSTNNLKSIIISGGIPNENLDICIKAIQKSSGTSINKINNKLIIKNN